MKVRTWLASAVDTAIAVVATLAAVWAALERNRSQGGVTIFVTPHHEAVLGGGPPPSAVLVLGIVLTTAPLAFRRRYPATAFCVIMAATIATSGYTTIVTFAAVIFAAYSAVVYSRFRRMAVLSVAIAAIIVTAAFPNTAPPVPARYGALLVLAVAVAVAIAMRTWRQRAGDSVERLRRAEAEHEAETRRAVEAERARIASELHDVVTHNVSVMVVQAGAARRVLGSSPGQAPEAAGFRPPSKRCSRSRPAAGPRWASCGTCSACWPRPARRPAGTTPCWSRSPIWARFGPSSSGSAPPGCPSS